MTSFQIIPARANHAWLIARHMREADIIEVAACGYSPLSALVEGYKSSAYCKTILIDGEPSMMFGVAPLSLLRGDGSPWLLGTEAVHKARRPFLRASRRVIVEMLALFPHLVNYVDARNTVSIEWLAWLGFRIHPAVPIGQQGEPFHLFEMRKAVCAHQQH